MNSTIIGVDLAKNVIQVCVVESNKVASNKEMTFSAFGLWLAKNKPQTIVFEACGTSNYWKQIALKYGHTAHIISAVLVSSIRQHQKSDKNDALAIAQAALLPEVVFISGKNIEQQQLQSVMRLRELCVKQKVATNNQLQALLLEFNIRVSSRRGGLGGQVANLTMPLQLLNLTKSRHIYLTALCYFPIDLAPEKYNFA